jgi:hypothetical protein
MERAQYAAIQGFDERSQNEFEELLAASTFTIEPASALLDTHEARADAYVAAGKKVTERSDVLIALWNGGTADGKWGGTGHTLLNAAARSKACVWISTEDDATDDNLDAAGGAGFYQRVQARADVAPDHQPGTDAFAVSPLASLASTFQQLDAHNREPRPGEPTGRFTGALGDVLLGARFVSRFESTLAEEIERRRGEGWRDWLVAPSARASLLAAHYQERFRLLSKILVIAATLAAAMLGAGVASGVETLVWGALECGFLIIALIAFVVVRRMRFHARWRSYRVLAERFRTARYVGPTGIALRDQARLQGLWVGGHSEDWLMRAFEEVWDREPHDARLITRHFDEIKHRLAEGWIQGQINYHTCAHRQHDRLRRRLTRIVYVAFGLTVVLAAVDAVLASVHSAHYLQDICKGLTIFLPVLGASVGAALTIDQHQALAEHSGQMQSNLRVVKADLESATDATSLREATMAAVRVIAPETGTWFGALWFLDIEHP